jgi:hypothetical protein
MKSFFLHLYLHFFFFIFLLLRSLDLNLFLRNGNVLDSDSLIDGSIILDAGVGLFIEAFVVPAHSLILLSLIGIQDVFGKMPMVGNPSYLITVDVFANQLLSVFNCSLLSSVHCTSWPPSNALPESNVHVFGAFVTK